jgi:hypothetical protein
MTAHPLDDNDRIVSVYKKNLNPLDSTSRDVDEFVGSMHIIEAELFIDSKANDPDTYYIKDNRDLRSSRAQYVQRKLEAVPAQQREILEALQVLEYKLIPLSADEDGDASWIVQHESPYARATQVKQKAINRRWMLHVTLEDIPEVEKYAVDQMWGVVSNYRALAND